jgi:hypothetical protein
MKNVLFLASLFFARRRPRARDDDGKVMPACVDHCIVVPKTNMAPRAGGKKRQSLSPNARAHLSWPDLPWTLSSATHASVARPRQASVQPALQRLTKRGRAPLPPPATPTTTQLLPPPARRLRCAVTRVDMPCLLLTRTPRCLGAGGRLARPAGPQRSVIAASLRRAGLCRTLPPTPLLSERSACGRRTRLGAANAVSAGAEDAGAALAPRGGRHRRRNHIQAW